MRVPASLAGSRGRSRGPNGPALALLRVAARHPRAPARELGLRVTPVSKMSPRLGGTPGGTWQQIARRVEPDFRKSCASPVMKMAGTGSTPAASTISTMSCLSFSEASRQGSLKRSAPARQRTLAIRFLPMVGQSVGRDGPRDENPPEASNRGREEASADDIGSADIGMIERAGSTSPRKEC